MLQRKRELPNLPGRKDDQDVQSSVQIGEVRKICLSEMQCQLTRGDRSDSFRLNGKKGIVSKFEATGNICVNLLDERTGQETNEVICNLHPRALSLSS